MKGVVRKCEGRKMGDGAHGQAGTVLIESHMFS